MVIRTENNHKRQERNQTGEVARHRRYRWHGI